VVGLGFNSGFCACQEGALLLDSHLQTILLWLFWRFQVNYLPRLALNRDPPDLSEPSHQCLMRMIFFTIFLFVVFLLLGEFYC
jgi:hypothetical protein